MRVIDLNEEYTITDKTYIALGFFDGMHIAHRALINTAVEEAKRRGISSSVLLFKNNFKSNFQSEKHNTLTSNSQKLEILEGLGVDYVYTIEFNEEFMKLSKEQYITKLLVHDLKVAGVVVGFDYSFGSGASGNVETLKEFSVPCGYELTIVDPIKIDGEIVSSTNIKDLIRSGDAVSAEKLLSRYYTMIGKVVPGKHLGSKFGFPTANIEMCDDYVYPDFGVYITKVKVAGEEKYAVTSVGRNLTLDEEEIKIEAHILDFDRKIYGETIEISFIKKIREMIKFDSIETLMAQIDADINAVKSII